MTFSLNIYIQEKIVICHFLLQCMKVKSESEVKLLSHVQLLVTPWTAAYQAPPSMGFSRQEYWSGLPLTSPSLHELTANLKKLFSQFHKLCKSSLWGNTRSLLHKCDNLNFNQISISCQRIVSVI